MILYNKLGLFYLSKFIPKTILSLTFSRFKHVELSYSIIDARHPKSQNSKLSPDKPCMLVIHGLFGNKKNFESLAKGFSKATGIQVVTADVRNHGDSGHADDMDYRVLSQDMIHLVADTLHLNKAIVLGHSMGGKIAMIMALTKPEMVNGLVVGDISPGDSMGAASDFFVRIKSQMMQLDFTGKSLGEARKYASDALAAHVEDRRVLDFLLTNLVVRDGAVRWRINLPSLQSNYQSLMSFPHLEGAPQFRGPTLFIGGSKSNYIRPENEGTIRKFFPAADITMMPNAGHWVHSDDPVNFTKHVVQFIELVHPTIEK